MMNKTCHFKKMRMNLLLITSVLTLVGASSFAANKPVANSKELSGDIKKIDPTACKACEELPKMTKAIQGLNVDKDDDRLKGGDLVLSAVDLAASIKTFDAKNEKRKQAFRDLVLFSIEASPFDGESQLAQIISDLNDHNSDLKTIYSEMTNEKTASSPAAVCKLNRLAKSVEENSCTEKVNQEMKSQPEAKRDEKIKKCIQPFNYEECLKKAEKQKSAPSKAGKKNDKK